MTAKTKITFLTIITLILFVVSSILIFQAEAKNKPLPYYGGIQPFSLTSSKEKNFGLADLDGKIWVADFMFTTCAGICPVMSKNMAALHRSYALEDNVRFVSISVNPENDTPERLAKYAQTYAADTDKWLFLTGKREDIKKLAVNSFKLGSVEEPVFHSSKFVLVDSQSRIRGYYEGTDDKEVRTLFKDLARLLKESRS